jgi:hypothetical protein
MPLGTRAKLNFAKLSMRCGSCLSPHPELVEGWEAAPGLRQACRVSAPLSCWFNVTRARINSIMSER